MVSFETNDCFLGQDRCCPTITLSTTGVSNSSQAIRMGLYERVDTYFDRPVYLHSEVDEYLFYMGGRSRGLWMVGPEVGLFSGGLANRGDTICIEDVRSEWKYADGSGWSKDPLLKAKCAKDSAGKKIVIIATLVRLALNAYKCRQLIVGI